MDFKQLAITMLLAVNIHGAEWFVSSSGSGNGSLNSPGSLATALAHSGWAASVAAGDTVWLRAGTYTPGTLEGDYWAVAFSGSEGSLVTWRSATNEWAKIDRQWRFGNYRYHRFRDLEFYDSFKGSYTTNPSEDLYLHFDDSSPGPANEWINCVIHDVENCWSGDTAGASVRGCILWYVGNANRLEHMIYPQCLSLVGNINAWCSGATVELGADGMKIADNIVWGQSQANTSLDGGEPDFRLAQISATMTNNFTYHGIGNTTLAYGGPLSGGTLVLNSNVFATATVGIAPNGAAVNQIIGNVFHMNAADNYAIIQAMGYGTGTWTWDYNKYTARPPSTVRFEDPDSMTYAEWKTATGFDANSVATNSALPADAVYVIANQDQAKRAHIAVYNWTGADNVTVNVSSVLASTDYYQLYSAQNYQYGPIKSGTLEGATITVPMTNLTVAPILYGGGIVYGDGQMTNPPATSPEFAAFVLIGSAHASQTATIRTTTLRVTNLRGR